MGAGLSYKHIRLMDKDSRQSNPIMMLMGSRCLLVHVFQKIREVERRQRPMVVGNGDCTRYPTIKKTVMVPNHPQLHTGISSSREYIRRRNKCRWMAVSALG